MSSPPSCWVVTPYPLRHLRLGDLTYAVTPFLDAVSLEPPAPFADERPTEREPLQGASW
jgi:hypothetical protein